MITIQKKRGDTWKFVAWIADDEGVAITDFTNYEIWLTVKKQESDTDENAVAQITLTGGGIVITDSGAGEVTGTIEASITSGFEVRIFVLDWQVKTDTNIYQSSETFNVKCIADITGAT